MFKLDLEKAEEPEIKLPTSTGSWKKQENSSKTSTCASLTTLKPLTVWITTNCRKFFKRWEYQATLPASWEICMQVKQQQLEADTEKWTSCKLGKEYVKAVYCHPAYLTYMQSSVQFISVTQSCLTLQPHELQNATPPCSSPSPGVHSDSRPSSPWCHPAISSSVVPFFSCPQSLPALTAANIPILSCVLLNMTSSVS